MWRKGHVLLHQTLPFHLLQHIYSLHRTCLSLLTGTCKDMTPSNRLSKCLQLTPYFSHSTYRLLRNAMQSY